MTRSIIRHDQVAYIYLLFTPITMSLIDEVKKICNRLAHYGWRDVLLQHGIDITAEDLKSELLKELPNINRRIKGFLDFSMVGKRGIEPGNPARSLLYHALASPLVVNGINDIKLDVFPTLAEIETVENYVYGIQPPSLEQLSAQMRELINNFHDGRMAITVFASEYRPGPETVHKLHADKCFSRTGVARIGTTQPFYDAKLRGFLPFDDNDQHGFRVLPAKYSAYVAAQLNRQMLKPKYKDIFGPMRYNGKEDTRKFWIPIHKLFDGDECIQGLNLRVTFTANHVNEKIKRVHLQLEKIPGYPKTNKDDTEKPPYRFTTGIAELSSSAEFGQGLLVPVPHSPLVQPAMKNGNRLTFLVPSKPQQSSGSVISYDWNPSLQINNDNGARHAPEFVHVRHKVFNDQVQDLNDDPNVTELVMNGNYNAQHYIDFTGDGWIEVNCPELASFFPQHPISAYSLITAPDFYPNVDQGDLMDWYIHNVPEQLRDKSWYDSTHRNNLETLSDQRLAANIELNSDVVSGIFSKDYPFYLEDDSVTSIVSLPLIDENRSVSFEDNTSVKIRHAYLPDAASGVFAPGWDVSFDNTRGVDHFSAYGLGSPFPEDSKLCAAISSFWPAVAPDAGRSFWWSSKQPPGVFPTVSPLTDSEIGEANNLTWDGYNGPIVNHTDSSIITYLKSDYIDYVNNMIENKFTLSRTGKVDFDEYRARILSIAKVFLALQKSVTHSMVPLKVLYPVLSFRKVSTSNAEVNEAQTLSQKILQGDIYRIEIFKGKEGNSLNDQKKIEIRVIERYVFFTGTNKEILVKHNDGNWVSISTL
jgi:hypothetical protein